MEPVIPATELMPETTASVAQRIAELQAAGATDRQVLTELAKAAMAAAEDAAFRLRTYLADGWNGDPMQVPTTGSSTRDRQLLAALVAAHNAATLTEAARSHQHIDRPAGWDPLYTR